MSLSAPAHSPLVHAAARRPAATVALDLRLAGRVAAVAVERRGALAAWAVVAGGDDPVALARRALRELRVRPRRISVLLGAAGSGGTLETQVAVLGAAKARPLDDVRTGSETRADAVESLAAEAVLGYGAEPATRNGTPAQIRLGAESTTRYGEDAVSRRGTDAVTGIGANAVAKYDEDAANRYGTEAVPGDGAEAPGEAAIVAALFAEGYERLREPAVAALPLSRDAWLVAACEEAAIEALAAGLVAESGLEPAFVVDQMLAAADLAAGAATVDSGEIDEHGETALLIAADPPASARFVRALPATLDLAAAARECRESLAAAGCAPGAAVEVRGPRAAALSRLLAEGGVAARVEAPPACGGERLPAVCGLAWRLALQPGVPALASPRSDRRRASLAWARRAARIAVAVAALGALLMAAGLWLLWVSAARNRALMAQAAGETRLVAQLRAIGALAEEAGRRRNELAGQAAPWPRLAAVVGALARQLPPEVAWERLRIADGALELEASAAGAAALARLATLRHALERSPGIANLSWSAPTGDPHGNRVRQVFRAVIGAP
jgi:hypothetical protein